MDTEIQYKNSKIQKKVYRNIDTYTKQEAFLLTAKRIVHKHWTTEIKCKFSKIRKIQKYKENEQPSYQIIVNKQLKRRYQTLKFNTKIQKYKMKQYTANK